MSLQGPVWLMPDRALKSNIYGGRGRGGLTRINNIKNSDDIDGSALECGDHILANEYDQMIVRMKD